MNSLRIAIVGVLVDRWGTEQAEGLLHFFEGWVIFIVCAAILAAEIWLFARLGARKSFFDVFHFPKVSAVSPPAKQSTRANWLPMMSCILLVGASGAASFYLSARQEIVPERLSFVSFPADLGTWQGRRSLLEPQVEHVLGLDDYILSDYRKAKTGVVNFYVAYYASQRKGSSPHSPSVCIPGDGWQITKFERTAYHSDALGVTVPLNRAVIARDSNRQLVYYWFVQRGRSVANEYWSKWFLFTDAITKNRTDGALVRLVTPLYPGETEDVADARLKSFIDDLQPRLKAYLPADTAPNVSSLVHHQEARKLEDAP